MKRSRLAGLMTGEVVGAGTDLAEQMRGLGEELVIAEEAEILALDALARLAYAELSSPPDRERDPQCAVERVVLLARDLVPGAEHAGAALIEGTAVCSLVTTDQVVRRCDSVQSDLGEGPILDAREDGAVLHVDDLGADRRWPRFRVAAAKLGIGSVLVCGWPMSQRRRGVLALYADRPGAFGAAAPLVASTLAGQVSMAAHHADRVRNLQEAIASRQVIGQATGVLMERYKVDADTAFRILVDASQRAHIKVRQLAVQVTETGEDPRELAR